jgi:hypothetical protein
MLHGVHPDNVAVALNEMINYGMVIIDPDVVDQ